MPPEKLSTPPVVTARPARPAAASTPAQPPPTQNAVTGPPIDLTAMPGAGAGVLAVVGAHRVLKRRRRRSAPDGNPLGRGADERPLQPPRPAVPESAAAQPVRSSAPPLPVVAPVATPAPAQPVVTPSPARPVVTPAPAALSAQPVATPPPDPADHGPRRRPGAPPPGMKMQSQAQWKWAYANGMPWAHPAAERAAWRALPDRIEPARV